MKKHYTATVLQRICNAVISLGIVGATPTCFAQIMYPGTPIAVGPAAGELVWRWADDSCSYGNLPDAPVRAFRDAENMINLTIPHYENYRLRGSSFGSLSRDCNMLLGSPNNSNPAQHLGAHWVQSVYTEDGSTVHAILHNENFDEGGYGTGDYYSTSACYAVSNNGGANFSLPENHVIFSPSANQTARPFAPLGHDGLQPFSNIFKHNGYYYFFGYITLADHSLMTPANTPLYLFRSDDIADPAAWRGWDGDDFTVLLGNAYTESLNLGAMKGVGQDTPWDGAMAQLGTNVTWNSYFQKFMMVGISSKSGIYGIYYSLSEDLMNWSVRVPLKLFSSAYQMGLDIVPNPSKTTVTYATVIDHDDTSRNFENSDSTIYLYWVENSPATWGTQHYAYARSLRRQALTLTKNIVHEFVVTSRLDIDDVNNGDGLARGQNGANFVNTLRAALTESSSRPPYAINDTLRIRFNIPGSNQTINLGSDLPSTYRVGIDGSTQSGTVLNSSFLPNGLNLVPKIKVLGGLLPLRHESSYIKNIEAAQIYMYGNNQRISHSRVQDLSIEARRILVGGEGNSNRIGKIALLNDSTIVEANFIGLDNNGTSSIALDNDPLVRMYGSNNILSNNLIGGALNQAIQVEPDSLNGRFAANNTIENNLVGLSPDQQSQGYIQNDAIEIKNGAHGTVVRDNYISGAHTGIYLANSHQTEIYRNTIGTANSALFGGNRNAGIWITGTSSDNRIGNENWADRNIILGNSQQGITFLNLQGQGNQISKCRIEQNPAGALSDPASFQPTPLQPLSVYLSDDNDSLSVQCTNDTFALSGLYTIEAYQTAALSGFAEAEHLIASAQRSAGELGSFQLAINEEAYRSDLPFVCFLLTDPNGNTSVLSSQSVVLSPSLAPVPHVSVLHYETDNFVETFNTVVENTGAADLNWSVEGLDWAFVEPSSGNIAPGESATLSITLFRGDYCGTLGDTLYLVNNSFVNNAIPLTVSMAAYPQAAITYTTSLNICPGDNVLLRGTQGSDFQYTWFRNGLPIGITSQNYMASIAGNYTVAISAGNCTDTSEVVTVSLSGSLSATVSMQGNTSLCNGQSVLLQANTGAGYVYQWLNNSVPIGGATQSTYAANATGNYAVRITSGGCTVSSSPVTIGVTSPPPASASISGSSSICSGQSVIIQANPGSGLTYQWLLNGSEIANANSTTLNATSGGSYQVRVSQNGCSNVSNSIAINVNSLPFAAITPASETTFCEGASVQLNASTGAGYTYMWMLNGNQISGANAATYLAETAGNYSVRTSAAGCENTSEAININVNPIPSAAIIPASETTFCDGASVQLNASTGAGYTYVWMLNGNQISGANAATYLAETAGNYSVRTSAAGCENTSEAIDITVNPIPSAAIISASETTFCEGASVQLNASTGAGYTYMWMLNGNPISGANAATYLAETAGNYSVRTSAAGCESTSEAININVNPIPAAAIIPASETTVCEGASVQLNASTGVGYTYLWMLNGNPISGANASAYLAETAGSYSVKTTALGCENTSEAINITVNPLPNAQLTAAPAAPVCEGETVTLNATPGNGYSFEWMLNGTPIAGANSANYIATSSGFYSINVNSVNCEVTSTPLEIVIIELAPTPIIALEGNYIVLITSGEPTWYLNGEAIAGTTSDSLEITAQGVYTCQVNAETCPTEFSNEVIILPLSSSKIAQLTPSIYPNPNNGIVHFTSNNWDWVAVYNAAGQCVYSQQFNSNDIDLTRLSSGIYTLQIGMNSTIGHQRIILNN